MPIEINRIPSPGATLMRALRSSFKGKKKSPDVDSVVMNRFQIDSHQLELFNRLVGFSDHFIPSTYLHAQFFGLRVLLIANKHFPFPLAGMVHLTDKIILHRQLSTATTYRVECCLGRLLAHEKGTAFEIITNVYQADELVWEENTINLFIGQTQFTTEEYRSYEFEELPVPATEILKIGSNMGRRYAKVSGDYNPIHLHPLGARLFGFNRTLMHGWFGLNKILVFHEDWLDGPHEIFVGFKKPMYLPAEVYLKEELHHDRINFAIEDRKEGYPNLKGYITRI